MTSQLYARVAVAALPLSSPSATTSTSARVTVCSTSARGSRTASRWAATSMLAWVNVTPSKSPSEIAVASASAASSALGGSSVHAVRTSARVGTRRRAPNRTGTRAPVDLVLRRCCSRLTCSPSRCAGRRPTETAIRASSPGARLAHRARTGVVGHGPAPPHPRASTRSPRTPRRCGAGPAHRPVEASFAACPMRRTASVSTSWLVARLRRTCPAPPGPKCRPSLSATLARSRKNR